MTDEEVKESMLIAEEIAKEICTGKTSTSSLAQQWKEQSPDLYHELRKQEQLAEEIAFHDAVDTQQVWEEISRHIAPAERRMGRRTLYKIGIAASFLLILGAAGLWLWNGREAENMAEWAASIPENPNPCLTVQNDQPVELTENSLAVKGNQLVGSSLDGKKNIAINLRQDKQFNKLAVPRGGGYQLTLEDGTTVKVNAASELLFPTHFDKHSRQVRLQGEACFQVEKDAEKPFYVQLGDLHVQVTGTTFNIKAYEEDETIQVALIEGSVNVREGQKVLATLAPGQLFTYRKAERVYEVSQANLSAVTGWTEGKFIFYNETIGTIMHELSRWYDVDIRVGDDIREMRYSGILSRRQPLAEMLNALRLTNELDFKFYENKTIEAIDKREVIKH